MTSHADDQATTVELYLGEAIAQQLPLPEGLRALAQELRPGGASRSLARLAAEVSQGRPLTDALADVHSELPHDLRVLMLSGAQSGRLGEVMENYAGMIRRRRALKRDLWTLLSYPAFLLALIFGVAMLNWLVIYPTLLDVNLSIQEFRLDSPMTPWVLGISWLAGPGSASMMLFLSIFVLLLAITWPVGGRRVAHVLRRQIPLIGPLFRYHAVREFAELLGMFVRYGLPLPDSLRFTAHGVGDASCAAVSLRLAGDVESGMRLGVALEGDSSSLLAPLAPMVTYGEQQGTVAETLDAAAEMYAGRAEVQGAIVKIALPPLLLLLITAVIGLMLMAIFWPLSSMLRLINSLT